MLFFHSSSDARSVALGVDAFSTTSGLPSGSSR
jgi:hypothetical protein